MTASELLHVGGSGGGAGAGFAGRAGLCAGWGVAAGGEGREAEEEDPAHGFRRTPIGA